MVQLYAFTLALTNELFHCSNSNQGVCKLLAVAQTLLGVVSPVVW